jgi:hypothetical protein
MEFTEARLKLKRAEHHIANIHARILALPKTDVASIEIDICGTHEIIKHDLGDKTFAVDVALILGDAVHNLRCALDYAWHGTLTLLAPEAIDRNSKFPVHKSREHLESAIRGLKVNSALPELVEMLISNIQPYNGGNWAIWPVHQIDKQDKHRLLIPTIIYSTLSGVQAENERGVLQEFSATATMQEPRWRYHMPKGWHVKQKGRISASIMFKQGALARDMRVLDTLTLYSQFFVQVVEALEAFCESRS